MSLPLPPPAKVSGRRILARPEDLFQGTMPTCWNFWKDGVTSSLLGSFLNCRKHTKVLWVDGYAPREASLALEFGSCCHYVLEKAYSPEEQWLSMQVPPDSEWIDFCVENYSASWSDKVPGATPRQLEIQEQVYALAKATLPGYFQRWDGDFTGAYNYGTQVTRPCEWFNLETNFKVDFTLHDGKVVPCRGRRDAVFKDEHGKIRVFDTKCLSVIKDDVILDTLEFDLQQNFYMLATIQDLGVYPAGCVKNIIRRPGQRQGKRETATDFYTRIAAFYVDPANFDHCFSRFELSIMPQEIDEYADTVIRPIVNEVRMWYEGKLATFMNPSALDTKYGRSSLFWAVTRGDMSACYKKSYVFPELEY